ncbi:MAG: hypothetical protein KBD55_03210, partial [Candidatus Pacebacteria bacterium]|nr:hypothetical protein [Candidatus Paceibacterota bacterium]
MNFEQIALPKKKEFKLAESIGADWKERAFSGEFKHAEMAALTGVEVIPAESSNPSIEIARRVLEKNGGGNLEFKIIDVEGEPTVLITSKIGEDVFYVFCKDEFIVAKNADDSNSKSDTGIRPYKLGIYNPNTGTTFSLDQLINLESRSGNTIMFFEVEGKRHNQDRQITEDAGDKTQFSIINNFPFTPEEFATLLHESGHLLRNTRHVAEGVWPANKVDARLSKSQNLIDAENLSKARATVIAEERGASTIALVFLRELQKNGFDIASADNLDKIQLFFEDCLKTYDKRPFVPKNVSRETQVAP